MAPNSLACAFLALAYWAHKQLDAGRPTDDVICEVVEGHESWTVLCLAGALALETSHVSPAVLPIATSQRLWQDDFARANQESVPDIHFLGIGNLTRLNGDKATAAGYLNGRKSRFRSIRDLAPYFALSRHIALREAYAASSPALRMNFLSTMKSSAPTPSSHASSRKRLNNGVAWVRQRTTRPAMPATTNTSYRVRVPQAADARGPGAH